MNILYVRNLTFSFFSSNLAQVFYVVKRIESKLSTVLIERLEPSEYFSFLNYISPKIYRIHCAKYFRNQLPIAHQRLSVAAVRDCGLLSCPPPPKFERGRMFQLPLKPLLLLHFVSGMLIFNIIYNSIFPN